jgi:lysozyme family protein
MTSFDKALAFTLGIEGEFSNHPDDPGGATRYGITEATARRFGYLGDMRALPLSMAKYIYRSQYWDIIRLDDIAEVAEPVALEMFDTGVNCGPAVPVRFLQRVLNALNREGHDYPDITVDGLVGPATLHALSAFCTRRGKLGSQVLVEALNSLQGAYYLELAEKRVKNEAFMFGWLANRVLKRAE